MRPALPASVSDGVSENCGEPGFCGTCANSATCISEGFDEASLRALHLLVDHVGPYREGDYLFREGDAFGSIAAVQSGVVKTFVTDANGREQVQGFFLPGEIIGFNAIHAGRHPCNAVALDTVMLCRFSFPTMESLAMSMPGLQKRLFSLLSRDIEKAALLAGNYTAEERLAAFIVSLSRRLVERGFSSTRVRLTMARTDIANYLRLTPETVSRVLRRFQDEGLLKVDRRDMDILAPDALESLAHPVLRH